MPAFIDISGQKFTKLLVIERVENSSHNRTCWKCLCDCGNYTTVVSQSLKTGATTSCGCHRKETGNGFLDITGQKFNKLLVIERVENGKQNETRWRCLCDCGNYSVVTSNAVRNNRIKSCGCLRITYAKEHFSLPQDVAVANRLFSKVERGAINRNKSFTLSKSYFKKLIEADCYYCGSPPKQALSPFPEQFYNGIDRVNSAQGYIKENCVTCCKHCNFAKNSMTVEEFMTWIERVYNHLINIEKEN